MFVFAHTTHSMIFFLVLFLGKSGSFGSSVTGKPGAGVSVALGQRSSALADMHSLLVTVLAEGAVKKVAWRSC